MLASMQPSRHARDCCNTHVHLSERELEVLRLIAGGRTNAQIASALYISAQSVGRCIGTLLLRTQSDNRAELVARAYVDGVLDPTAWPPVLTGSDSLSVGQAAEPPARPATPLRPVVSATG